MTEALTLTTICPIWSFQLPPLLKHRNKCGLHAYWRCTSINTFSSGRWALLLALGIWEPTERHYLHIRQATIHSWTEPLSVPTIPTGTEASKNYLSYIAGSCQDGQAHNRFTCAR